MGKQLAIGVMAPATRIEPAVADAVAALAQRIYPLSAPRIHFHPQCFESEGHFAGSDAARAEAFVEIANDPAYGALWFARGGYGSGRLIGAVLPRLNAVARAKTYLGYSDAGAMLGALYARGFEGLAHGPMPQDLLRDGGEAAVTRALAWLTTGDRGAVEPTALAGPPTAAFNMAILCSVLGTPWQPGLEGHVLMLEEVCEHMYRIDRMMLQITTAVRGLAGIRLGRCSLIPPNEPDFVLEEEAVVRFWCDRSGIPYLGRADIGHDADNRVVPFGLGNRR